MSTRPKTAFVFAGGGSLGAIQVGMLKSLVAHGIEADLVVGSSVGAINAAYFAGDPSGAGIARLEAIWRGVRRSDVYPAVTLRGLLGLVAGRGHLVDSTGLARLLERHLPYRRLEQARLPCHIIATDLLEGIELRFSSGPAIPALLASAAIPGIFPAVHLNGRYLVDGGVANHTPISAAVELGAVRLYVLPTGYSCTLETPPKGAIAAALQGLNILIARQLINAIHRYRAQAEIIIVPPLCPLNTSPYDFDAVGELIDRAARSTAEWLEKGVALVDGVPHQLPPHSHRAGTDPYRPRWL
ncbi:MAG TPA: patatin-like phospholipase family protein [Candidatus Competibacteraceae bacterium]|nr:patatin-like phospholipase family protein [Candidatus Competibacteraceae bacterium]